MSLASIVVMTACGVGFVAISAFLAIVLVFLFVTVVGAVAERADRCRSVGAVTPRGSERMVTH